MPMIVCDCGAVLIDAYAGRACPICGRTVSSAILLPDPMFTPDPDMKDTTMTTFPAPSYVDADGFAADGPAPTVFKGTTPPLTLVHTRDDQGPITLTAHTADDVANLIKRANGSSVARAFVQKAKGGEGVGALGLYVEAVLHTGTGSAFTHMKFFVVDDTVFAYSRNRGDSRANWKRRKVASLADALTTVQKALDRPTVKLFGHPVLVELTSDDLSAIEEGGMPPARFRGQYRIEKDFGRYDFEMDISSSPVPTSLVSILRRGFTTPVPA